MEGIGAGLYSPAGYANAKLPGSATVRCGSVKQALTYTASGSTALGIGFTAPPLSWSSPDWIPDAPDGLVWVCQRAGVYRVLAQQVLQMRNTSDASNPVVIVQMLVNSPLTDPNDQSFRTTINVPITTGPILNSVQVGGIINAEVGTVMVVSVQSQSGNVTIVSTTAVWPNPSGFIQWNLIAEGQYGTLVRA